MQRILVTGGAGFIGSHLVERLLRDGAEVRVLDDLSSGRVENLNAVRHHQRFLFRRDRVEDAQALEEMARGVDWIFHLAAVVGVKRVVEHPVASQSSLLRGNEAVLECARRVGAGVLYASSSEVYGRGDAVPFREKDGLRLGSPEHDRWGYAAAKAMGEFQALAYHRELGVPVVVARFFNTVGPRQSGRFGMVVPRFVKQALGDSPLTVYGDGEQSRCFTDVRDTVEAIVRLWKCEAALGRVVNVGSDREFTIRELAHKVLEACDSRSEVARLPYDEVFPAGFQDVRRRVPSLERLEELTGYRPGTPLEETLAWIVASLGREERDAAAADATPTATSARRPSPVRASLPGATRPSSSGAASSRS